MLERAEQRDGVLASRVIVRELLSWKTRPGACEVEPPVSQSGPWSTSTTSVQPSRVR